MNKPEEALRIAEEINHKRMELKTLESRFYSIFGETAVSYWLIGATGKRLRRQSLCERMRNVLKDRAGTAMAVKDLQRALPPETSVRTIRSTVNRLVSTSNGVFVSPKRGVYQYAGADMSG